MRHRRFSLCFTVLFLLFSQLAVMQGYAQDDDFLLFVPSFLAKLNHYRFISYAAYGNENSFAKITDNNNISFVSTYTYNSGNYLNARVRSTQHSEKAHVSLSNNDLLMVLGDVEIHKQKGNTFFMATDNVTGASYKIDIAEETAKQSFSADFFDMQANSESSLGKVHEYNSFYEKRDDQQTVGKASGLITISSYCPQAYNFDKVTVYDHGIFGSMYDTCLAKVNDSQFTFFLNINPVDEFEINPGLYCRKLNQQLYSVCLSGMLADVIGGGNSISKTSTTLLNVLNSNGLVTTPERLGLYYDLWSSALMTTTTVSGELFSDCDQFLKNIVQCEAPKLITPRVTIDLYRGSGIRPPTFDRAMFQVAENEFSIIADIDLKPTEQIFNIADYFAYDHMFLRQPHKYQEDFFATLFIKGACGSYCVEFKNATLSGKCYDLQQDPDINVLNYLNLAPIHNAYIDAWPFPDVTNGYIVRHKESGNVVEGEFNASLIGGERVARMWYFVQGVDEEGRPSMVMHSPTELVNDLESSHAYLYWKYEDYKIFAKVLDCKEKIWDEKEQESYWVDTNVEKCSGGMILSPYSNSSFGYIPFCGGINCDYSYRSSFQLHMTFGGETSPISNIGYWNYD